MTTILMAILKRYMLALMSEEFLDWGLRTFAKWVVESTKTKKDDEWYAKFEEVYNEQKGK